MAWSPTCLSCSFTQFKTPCAVHADTWHCTMCGEWHPKNKSHSQAVPNCLCGTFKLDSREPKSSLGTAICPVHAK
jgi:hypothetical protein